MNNNVPLLETLQLALRTQQPGALCVAYSGGPDSTALLHALASLPEAHARGLRALHVDHGLHTESARWAAHCRAFCATLGVACDVRLAKVDRLAGIGLEAAARHARYAIFAEHLHANECLLLGHHQDDQVETVLLKLLRGAGPEGLGGMRAQRPLGRGMLWRPLLTLPRQVLCDYVDVHQLPCIHDPSNDDTRLARNHLRHDILPRLKAHWPQAVVSITHSALLCRAAADTLQQDWLVALEVLRDDTTNSLDACGWLALPSALRDPLLAHWLHAQGLPAPTTAQRQQIERQCTAQDGQLPCIQWPGAEVHVWKHRLWAMAPRRAAQTHAELQWQGEALQLPDGGLLTLEPTAQLPVMLNVRWRGGGERIKPTGDRYTRDLRSLFQTGAIPPWQRDACPLLYEGDELIAVADRWLSARAEAIFSEAEAQPCWMPGR
ncbi:tRNA(Ile)-lysidine synthase [Dyella lipolytica]|uniref:tRNA lysidine(34) synthetase TilS n=1 Tax=Dyella lipolytica TaxID=1867835 RepID=UPI00235C525F|nr:tRNA lysidine(34) synthetase TilS [Dyella lipolytica]GLQ45250.1 tRNA(Ile)-lysidine synthase [Dyella lipolytica]